MAQTLLLSFDIRILSTRIQRSNILRIKLFIIERFQKLKMKVKNREQISWLETLFDRTIIPSLIFNIHSLNIKHNNHYFLQKEFVFADFCCFVLTIFFSFKNLNNKKIWLYFLKSNFYLNSSSKTLWKILGNKSF